MGSGQGNRVDGGLVKLGPVKADLRQVDLKGLLPKKVLFSLHD